MATNSSRQTRQQAKIRPTKATDIVFDVSKIAASTPISKRSATVSRLNNKSASSQYQQVVKRNKLNAENDGKVAASQNTKATTKRAVFVELENNNAVSIGKKAAKPRNTKQIDPPASNTVTIDESIVYLPHDMSIEEFESPQFQPKLRLNRTNSDPDDHLATIDGVTVKLPMTSNEFKAKWNPKLRLEEFDVSEILAPNNMTDEEFELACRRPIICLKRLKKDSMAGRVCKPKGRRLYSVDQPIKLDLNDGSSEGSLSTTYEKSVPTIADEIKSQYPSKAVVNKCLIEFSQNDNGIIEEMSPKTGQKIFAEKIKVNLYIFGDILSNFYSGGIF